MDWTQEVMKARPNLKPNSVKSYVAKLKKCDQFIPGWRDMEADELLTKIDDLEYTDVYRRNLLTAILIIITMDEQNKHGSTFTPKLSKIRKTVWEKNDNYQAKNNINTNEIASENQKNNIISYDDLVKYVRKVGKDIQTQQDHMIYCILLSLLHVPVRNDMAGMKFIGKREYNKIDIKEEQNYLMYCSNPKKYCYCYYQDDTTTKTRPMQIQELPRDLSRELKYYISRWGIDKGDILYPISKNNLSQVLTKTSKKYTGKNVSTTLIRKIVASHKFNHIKNDMAEQSELASKMGHSVATQNAVYNKAIPK